MINVHNRLLVSSVAALLAAPAAALAQPYMQSSAHSYTYVEGGYLNRDNDFVDEDGFRIAGSGAIARSLALIGEYDDTDDYEQLSAGAIVFAPISRDLDWLGGATIEFADSGRSDDTGFGLRGGLRYRFARAFELNPELRYVDVFEESGASLRLAGLFSVSPNVAVQAALQGGDDDRFEAGLRYNFVPTAGPRRTY
jgi:hypothetical protein